MDREWIFNPVLMASAIIVRSRALQYIVNLMRMRMHNRPICQRIPEVLFDLKYSLVVHRKCLMRKGGR